MNKTKSQLRAEAVERLRKLNCMDVDCYQLLEAVVDDAGEKVGYRVEIRKLIDLLTDDETCPNSDGTCPDADRTASIEQGDGVAKLDAQARAEIEDMKRSRAVSGDAAAAVDAGTGGTEKTPQEPLECARITFTDTREMLEADVRTYMFPWRVDMALDWLDRQAAITERECANEYVNTWDEGSVAWILRQYEDEKLMRDVDCDMHVLLETEEFEDKIAELQVKVDALEAENARLRSRMSDDAEYGRLVMDAYRELRAKLDEIAKVVDA